MLHQEPKGRLFGYFDRALDLVHGFDAAALFHVHDVQRWFNGAGEIIGRKNRRVHGVELHLS